MVKIALLAAPVVIFSVGMYFKIQNVKFDRRSDETALRVKRNMYYTMSNEHPLRYHKEIEKMIKKMIKGKTLFPYERNELKYYIKTLFLDDKEISINRRNYALVQLKYINTDQQLLAFYYNSMDLSDYLDERGKKKMEINNIGGDINTGFKGKDYDIWSNSLLSKIKGTDEYNECTQENNSYNNNYYNEDDNYYFGDYYNMSTSQSARKYYNEKIENTDSNTGKKYSNNNKISNEIIEKNCECLTDKKYISNPAVGREKEIENLMITLLTPRKICTTFRRNWCW